MIESVKRLHATVFAIASAGRREVRPDGKGGSNLSRPEPVALWNRLSVGKEGLWHRRVMSNHG